MRSFCLFVALVFFLQWSPARGLSSDQPQVSLKSVQADFLQEKHLKILVHPITSRGRFVFQAPASLRWEYTEPFHSILLMNKGRVRKFVQRNGQLTEEQGLQPGAMQVVLAEISGWLDGRFTENKDFTTSFTDKRTIRLVPKAEGMRSFISAIELKLGRKKGVLDAVTIFEGPKSFTRLLFSHAVVNQSIRKSLFTRP